MELDEVLESIETLFDQWAARRNYLALKHLLNGWPLTSGLTDDWANLLDELKYIFNHLGGSLSDDENKILAVLIREIDHQLWRRY
jgi:hypothetical protein